MEIRIYRNPKGRKPTPNHTIVPEHNNVRLSVREARRALRSAWALHHSATTVIRVGVYNAAGKLEWQGRIDTASAERGWRRMIVEEER